MRAQLALITVLLFAGCSSAGNGSSNGSSPTEPGGPGGTSDAGANDGGNSTPSDGGQPPVPDAGSIKCDASKPFGPPHPVSDVPEPDAFQLAFSPDELTAYYTVTSKVGNAADIHSASRAAVTSAYGPPTVIANSGSSEKRPSVTADGLTLFFYAGGIMKSTRTSTAAPFSAPVSALPFGEAPFVARDGSVFYFEDPFGMPDGNHREISVTNPAKGALATDPVLPAHDSHAELDYAPVVSDDALLLFFSRNGVIHVSTRATPTGTFGAPSPITQLTAAPGTWDFPSYYSADGCRLYFDRLLPPVTTDRGVPYVAVRGGT